MSKKKLLSEAQVRRFMGLAGLKPLNEMSHYKKDDEEAMEEGSYMKKDDEPLMEEEEMDMDAEEPAEMPGGDADVEMDEEDLADVKSALDMLQDKLGPLLDQAAGEEMDMDMDAEAPEMDMEDPEPMDMEDEEPKLDEELMEVDMEMTEDEIVNEVARRVAKRIVEAKRAHKKMNEALGRKTPSRKRRRR